jgi:hypothetical protein
MSQLKAELAGALLYLGIVRRHLSRALAHGRKRSRTLSPARIGDLALIAALLGSRLRRAPAGKKLIAFLPWTLLCCARARSPLSAAMSVALAAVWGAWHAAALKLVTLGRAPLALCAAAPLATFLAVVARPNPAVPSFPGLGASSAGRAAYRMLVRLLWDPPLLTMVRLGSAVGARFLHDGSDARRLLTDLGDESGLCMGSMPLAADVHEIASAGIVGVVNMQAEWAGPIEAYAAAGIPQLRLPTLDTTEPSARDLVRGVRFLRARLAEARATRGPKEDVDGRAATSRVFVHCKGGRGRATAMVLAFFVAEDADRRARGFDGPYVPGGAGPLPRRSGNQETSDAGTGGGHWTEASEGVPLTPAESDAFLEARVAWLREQRAVVEPKVARYPVLRAFRSHWIRVGHADVWRRVHSLQRAAKQLKQRA